MGEDDKSIYSDRDIFEQGASGMVATLALMASSGAQPLPVQGAMAMVGPFLGLGIGRYLYRAAHRRFPRFAIGFLRWYDPDPQKAQAKAQQAAEERQDDPDYHEVMYRSFKNLMDAADESVGGTIGYLAGMYTGKKADAFFRGMGRLLCDLESGELDQLRDLLTKVRTQSNGTQPMFVGLDNKDLVAGPNISTFTSIGNAYQFPKATRFFSLLKREQLAGNIPPPRQPYQPQASALQGRPPPLGDESMAILGVVLDQILTVIRLPSFELEEAAPPASD